MRSHRTGRGRRRSGVLLVMTGTLCLTASALPLFPATAEGEAGSGFGSFSLAANAPVVQLRVEYPQQYCTASKAGTAACEGVLVEGVSTMRQGPIGYALSSVGWPGTLGGNAGTLAVVAGGPAEAEVLNYPVRAENSISGEKDTVSYDQLPGAVMSATATETKVETRTSIEGAESPLGTFGRVLSTTRTILTGEKSAEAVAHSEVQDVVLGPLAIQAVVSDAKATTDSTKAVPTGGTRVVGASIAGVPVTFDERGLNVAGQAVPGVGDATAAVNEALSQAGMTIALSTPTGKPEGAGVHYTAGALNVVWKPDPTTTLTLLIGGASVNVESTGGFDVGSGGGDGGSTVVPPVVDVPGTTPPVDTAVPPGLSGGSAGLPGDTGTTTVPPTTAGPDTTPVASSSPALPGGLSPWYGVLAVLGAGLVMAGLRRLPDSVLAVPATTCPLGDTA